MKLVQESHQAEIKSLGKSTVCCRSKARIHSASNRPAVRLGAADVIIIPGGNFGNVSALRKGLMMMKDLGLI